MNASRIKGIPAGTWLIDEGIVDVPRFLRAVPKAFPEATDLCVEGTRICPEALAVYTKNKASGKNPWRRQTWFLSQRYVCRFSAAVFEELARVGESHEAHALLDHIAIFENGRWLIDWHDAFANAMLVSESADESVVATLVAPFGVKYVRAT